LEQAPAVAFLLQMPELFLVTGERNRTTGMHEAATARFAGPVTAAEVGGNMEPLRVFVVDDDEAFVQLVTAVLSAKFGHWVASETDAVKAVERIKAEQPDVVLLDLVMPRQDGYETLKFLLADEKTRDIPVVMLTNFDADKFRSMAERWGASAFIGKKAIGLSAFLNRGAQADDLPFAQKDDLNYAQLDEVIRKAVANRSV